MQGVKEGSTLSEKIWHTIILQQSVYHEHQGNPIEGRNTSSRSKNHGVKERKE